MNAPFLNKSINIEKQKPVAQLLLSLLPDGRVEMIKRGNREDLARLVAACARLAA